MREMSRCFLRSFVIAEQVCILAGDAEYPHYRSASVTKRIYHACQIYLAHVSRRKYVNY